MKALWIVSLVLIGALIGNIAWAEDSTILLTSGQTAKIEWINSELRSGPGAESDNPFTLEILNSKTGQNEDLRGVTSDAGGICPDFFRFAMTDMDMPDPASTYKRARHIVRTSIGIYEITDARFSMSSMQSNDWRITFWVNGQDLGSTTVTVSGE